GAGGDEPVGMHGASLADAMTAIDGLRFDGWVPPRIVENYIAGIGQVESGARGPQAEKEHGGGAVLLEVLRDSLGFLGFAGEDVSRDLAVLALGFQEPEHLYELGEEEDLLAFLEQRFEQFEQRVGLATQ